MALMALLLDNDEKIKRLQMASDRLGGDAELGRQLGYKNGVFVGHMLRGYRPITEKTIQKLLTIRKVADLFSWNANAGFNTAENEPMPPGFAEATEFHMPEPDLEVGRIEIKSRSRFIRPQAMGGQVERRLTRFLAVLFQLPESERDSALVAATEVLLDRLPPPPSA
jgi:hypothetical protein